MARTTLSPTMVTALVDMYLVMTRQGVTRLAELPCGGRTAAALEARGMITRDGDGWELTRFGEIRARHAAVAEYGDDVLPEGEDEVVTEAEVPLRTDADNLRWIPSIMDVRRRGTGAYMQCSAYCTSCGWTGSEYRGAERGHAMAAYEAREHVRVDHAEAEETTEAEVAHVMPLGHPRVGTAERRVTVTTPVAVAARRMPRKANRPKRRGWR